LDGGNRRQARFLSLQYRQVTAVEVPAAYTAGVRADNDVRLRQLAARATLPHDGERPQHEVHAVLDPAKTRLVGNVNRDDDIRPHVACGTYGHRAHETSIDVFVAIDRHRLKHTGHAARCAHCHTGIPGAKYDRLAALQIGGDRSERTVELF